ncbi:hypothetical protein GV791_14845 [Nocardia cyriacigeorgica]|uniref:Minor capsid protein n=1 Tax=Nocardia cyriacigeorgica TaxID=135487 RepID=A0A6P1CQ90_9NOCA|nr:hypothetical protein [Nocardia cyriacigeorgica]NEW33833.1 hypothetical protein [Nocardia cyriacigeorgica]
MFAALLAFHRRIARLLGRTVRRRLTVQGVPITPEQRRIIARRLHSEIVARRQQSYQVAAEQIREFDRELPVAPIREYPVEAVEAALERAVQPPQPRRTQPERHRGRPRARVTVTPAEIDPQSRRQSRARVPAPTLENRTDPAVVEDIADRVSATLTRHVQAAARSAVIDTAEEAGEEIGWARVLTGTENCAFCAMLASRGPVYKSDKSATWVVGRRGGRTRGTRWVGEPFHDNCDCEAVLVRRGEDWPGRADFERFERLWIAASTVADGDDEPRLVFNRAFRRSKNSPELHEELAQLWESSTDGLSGEEARAAFARAVRANPPAVLVAAQRPRRTPSE